MSYTPYKMKGSPMQRNYGIGSPAKKALVGNQANLPEELKAKIDASPAKQVTREQRLTDSSQAAPADATPRELYKKHKTTKKPQKAPEKQASPAKIAPLIAMAGKAIVGKMASKAVDKIM